MRIRCRQLKPIVATLVAVQIAYVLVTLSASNGVLADPESSRSTTPRAYEAPAGTAQATSPLTTDAFPDDVVHQLPSSGRWVEKLLGFYKRHVAAGRGPESYCEALRQYALDELTANDPSFTPSLASLLHDHNRMHEAVARGSPYPNQTYVVWSLSGGLGNRFQSLASTFMLALLSKRVLLLKDWFTPLPPNSKHNKPLIFPAPYTDAYQLEALEKLFWMSNPLVRETSPRPPNSMLLCPIFPMMSLTEFQLLYPHHFGAKGRIHPTMVGHVKVDLSARHDKKLVRWGRVACGNLSDHRLDADAPQRIVTSSSSLFFPEAFVYVWTNQYYLPLLYANPFHGDAMRQLLPRRPFSTLIKLLVLPSSHVMMHVTAFFERQAKAFPEHPLAPGSYAALQVRAFSYPEMPDLARSFKECYRRSDVTGKPFFLATMHEAIRLSFSAAYNTSVLRTQSARAAGDQNTGKGAAPDIEALVDMLLLSMGNKLFISPGSTFGAFAAAFGEIPAVRVNWKSLREGGGPRSLCTNMVSDQPCFGSWFKYDHLLQRSNLGTGRAHGNEIPCTLRPLPPDIMHC